MADKVKQVWIIYETENLINGKLYRGQHLCVNNETLDPRYFGKGILFKAAIKKHGKKNFKRRIICKAYSQIGANILERFYVDEKWIARDDTYNLVIGGGMTCGYHHTDDAKERIGKGSRGNKRAVGYKHTADEVARRFTPEANRNRSIAAKGRKPSPQNLKALHSPEAMAKRKATWERKKAEGFVGPNAGKKFGSPSEETNNKRRETWKKKMEDGYVPWSKGKKLGASKIRSDAQKRRWEKVRAEKVNG